MQGVSEVSVNLLTNSMVVVESDAPLEQGCDRQGGGACRLRRVACRRLAAGPAAKPGAPAQNPMQAQLKNMRMRLWVLFASWRR